MGAERSGGVPHWPALDGLRGVAVLLVVLSHAGVLGHVAGGHGVTVFFVLSGFLITQVLLRRGDGLAAFWAARLVRLVPALVAMVAVVGVACLAQGRSPGWYAGEALPALFYVENLRWARGEVGVLEHTWSLAVEEQFYLLWPLLLPLVLRGGVRRRVVLLGSAAALLAALRLGLAEAGHWSLAYLSLPTNAHALLLGCLLALAPPPARGRGPALAVGATVLALAVLSTLVTSEGAMTGAVVVAVAAAFLVHGATLGSPLLSAAPLRFAGRISYAWYLWHWPLLWLSGAAFDGERSLPVVAASLVLATASTWWLEEPLRRRWRARAGTPSPLG